MLSLINRFGKSSRSVGFSANIVVLITVNFSDLTCWAITVKLEPRLYISLWHVTLEPGILRSSCARWHWYVLYRLCFTDPFLILYTTGSSIRVSFPKSIIFTYLYFCRIFLEWRSLCMIPWICRFCNAQTKSKHTPFQCWNETLFWLFLKVFHRQYTPLEAYLAQ